MEVFLVRANVKVLCLQAVLATAEGRVLQRAPGKAEFLPPADLQDRRLRRGTEITHVVLR